MSGYDPTRHQRRSTRLTAYDYAQAGAYYVTICTQDRLCLFGEVVNGNMVLEDAGRAIWRVWEALPARFPHIALDAFVVMPNHIHGIIVITSTGAGEYRGADPDDHPPVRGEDRRGDPCDRPAPDDHPPVRGEYEIRPYIFMP